VLTDEAQAPAVFSKFMSTVAPSAAPSATTAQLFADDFTAFVYKDEKGVWPGYVASLKPGFSADTIRDWFSAIEKGTVSEFFISDPGKMGAFANGKVNGKYDDRYSSGTAAGASFGYLMFPQQGKVIISTSFTGIKEALRLMGL
jgi:hypothetical protein